MNADLNSQATLITNNTSAITTINNTLNNKSDKSDSYTRAEIIGFINSYYTFNGSFLKITDPSTGKFRVSLNPATINVFTLVKTNEIKVSTGLFLTISDDTLITGFLSLHKTLTITTPLQGGGN